MQLDIVPINNLRANRRVKERARERSIETKRKAGSEKKKVESKEKERGAIVLRGFRLPGNPERRQAIGGRARSFQRQLLICDKWNAENARVAGILRFGATR